MKRAFYTTTLSNKFKLLTMSKFLYGAAVQGIQSFIFQTNTLREIVGASELVEEICTKMFAEQLGISITELEKDENAIINAAGNIKYIFDNEDKCKEVFREFPKRVLEAAPGITISQAVIELRDVTNLSDALHKLEIRLREERNMPMQTLTLGLMGIQRSRETGLPERYHMSNPEDYCDEGTFRKRKAADTYSLLKKAIGEEMPDMVNITNRVDGFTDTNDWIAVIHADGNGLGQIVKAISENDSSGRDFHTFSSLLNQSTIDAAKSAAGIVFENAIKNGTDLPFRPVVLGGDDLTVIIRGSLAMSFIQNYLEAFEKFTKENFEVLAEKYAVLENGLTACAGIAYVKSSFPYYYAYNLAEELCAAAKKDSNREKSCIMFHKVQDSFVESYEDITKRELTTPERHSFKYGAYYLNDPHDRWTIDNLIERVTNLDSKDGNALKSDIRQWLSAMMEPNGLGKANQILDRIKEVNPAMKGEAEALTSWRTFTDKKGSKHNIYPAYDVLSLHSIIYQQTK